MEYYTSLFNVLANGTPEDEDYAVAKIAIGELCAAFDYAIDKSEELESDGTDFDTGFVAGYKMCIEDMESAISCKPY